MPNTLLLRVEGVNLSSFIEDCPDLKTIRGGSLLLRGAPQRILDYLAASRRAASAVSMGASIGVISIETEEEPAKLREEVEAWLSRHRELRYASFVVDVIRSTGQWANERESLLSANRHRQMEAPRLVYPFPPIADEPVAERVCKVDRVRPVWPHTNGLSPATDIRSTQGRFLRQDFYRIEAGDSYADLEFSECLENVACEAPGQPLADKMAIVYLDGNKFGALQARFESQTDQIRWDSFIRGLLKKALRALLDWAKSDSRWHFDNGRGIRLETLLWGGDELRVVVPAWLGWETLEFLYEQFEGLTFAYTGLAGPVIVPLTFAGGLVFCHVKAPIHPLNHLAKNLADLAKESVPSSGPAGNFFAYQVLESFDQIGKDFFGTLTERFGFLGRVPNSNAHLGGGTMPGSKHSKDLLILDGMRMKEIRRLYSKVQDDLPRRKVIALGQALLAGSDDPAALAEAIKVPNSDVRRPVSAGTLQHLDQLVCLLGGQPTGFFHLAELWDYIPSDTRRPA